MTSRVVQRAAVCFYVFYISNQLVPGIWNRFSQMGKNSSVYIFDWIFIISSNKDKHKNLDEFEILQDLTKDL